MTKRTRTNISASVHQRLLNKAHQTSRPFNEVLQYYAMERFLYRLSESPIMACFIRIAAAERTSKEKQAAEQRESQRRAEERARLHQRIMAEKSRVRALRRAAASWLRAEQLRSFVSAARDSARQGGQPSEVGTPFGNFLAWAEQQADRIDPLKESPTSIRDRKGEVEPPHSHYYGYQKPDPPFRFPKPIWRIK